MEGTNFVLSNEMCASSDGEKAYMIEGTYASAVGSIMYAVRCTKDRCGVCLKTWSVGYQQNRGSSTGLCFCDASWQCDKDDTKSQTGYVFVVNGGAVDWKSKKQTTPLRCLRTHTLSTWPAVRSLHWKQVWIRKFVEDLGVMPSIRLNINMIVGQFCAIIFAI
ncbi:hypothetical protein Tco_0266288 [Tanacetum coccineum]